LTRNTFPKSQRLNSKIAIDQLFKQGKWLPGKSFSACFKVIEAETAPQYLLSVPKKKLKKAPDRNRVKRLLREAIRVNQQDFTAELKSRGISAQIAFIYLRKELPPFSAVEEEIKEHFSRLKKRILANYEDTV